MKAGKTLSLCSKGWLYENIGSLANHEAASDGSGTGHILCNFRIAVEPTPEEIAERENAEKK